MLSRLRRRGRTGDRDESGLGAPPVERVHRKYVEEYDLVDLVTSWNSLEHTSCPGPFVEHLVRLLRPGGALTLTTLNQRSLAWVIVGTRWSMIVDDHFTYWTSRALRRLLQYAGLRIRVCGGGVGIEVAARKG